MPSPWLREVWVRLCQTACEWFRGSRVGSTSSSGGSGGLCFFSTLLKIKLLLCHSVIMARNADESVRMQSRCDRNTHTHSHTKCSARRTNRTKCFVSLCRFSIVLSIEFVSRSRAVSLLRMVQCAMCAHFKLYPFLLDNLIFCFALSARCFIKL